MRMEYWGPGWPSSSIHNNNDDDDNDGTMTQISRFASAFSGASGLKIIQTRCSAETSSPCFPSTHEVSPVCRRSLGCNYSGCKRGCKWYFLLALVQMMAWIHSCKFLPRASDNVKLRLKLAREVVTIQILDCLRSLLGYWFDIFSTQDSEIQMVGLIFQFHILCLSSSDPLRGVFLSERIASRRMTVQPEGTCLRKEPNDDCHTQV